MRSWGNLARGDSEIILIKELGPRRLVLQFSSGTEIVYVNMNRL